ncbi:MAG: glycoside hydrolase family 31 protein [Thermomicrobiales bacterium]|nr:glycoside hydrolase family 31 protein [Thermomicrobiales bacterium]
MGNLVQMDSKQLTIVHRPTGIDHPYEPYFEERRPRDPAAGDMVALGFLTRPGRMAERVRVDWTRNGRLQTPIFARALERATDEDRWLVELGVVEAGDRVEYRIEATGGEQRAETPTFAFVTRQWLRGDGSRLRVEDRGELGLRFSVVDTRLKKVGATDAEARLAGAADRLHLPRHDRPALPVTVRWQTEGERVVAVELTGELSPDESISGFGERFNALDQHGRALDTVVYEQYKNQGNRTYLPVPFMLSSEGYGLLVEGTAAVDFDLGRSVPDRWRFVAAVPDSGRFALHAYSGKPEAIVRALTAGTGRPEPLPAWAYGLWMSSNEWNTQARVEREVAETIRHEIPATVLVIEAWSDESTFYIWNGAIYTPRPRAPRPELGDFTFPEEGEWPDPAGMSRALGDAGIRLVLWQIPALKALDGPHAQHDADIAYALEQRYVLENEDGSAYRNPFFWFHDAFIPDFTSEAATEWWMGKRAYLLDEMGVAGFKTDGAEHLAGRGMRASDGRRGDELVNAYPNLYVGAYHRFANEHRGGDALTFSRAGHTGAGAFPAHWAGDENSTWEAYRRSIVAGLTAGLSGVIFWGWDIAGFSDALPSAELYLRSTAMAAFCPIMQYHNEYNPSGPSRDRTPWNIAARTGDERAISLFRHFARVRMNLLPYLVDEGRYAAEQGTPLMRPLFLDWPDDPTCWGIDDQYAFGRALLVAPVVEEGATHRTLYLPHGSWVDLWDGAAHEGGRWITVEAPWDRIPVFVRAGTTIPLRLGDDDLLGSDTGNGLNVTDGVVRWCDGAISRA